jgi:hypothetical protein
LDYPAEGRPIGVYIRVANRNFLYRLLMPDDPAYPVLDTLLDTHVGPARPKRMRQIRTTVDDLRTEWPDAPFWNVHHD